MPQLGLGLGLHKSSTLQTPLQQLLKYTSAMWLPSKADGINAGVNSPFTNPLVDLKNPKRIFDGEVDAGINNANWVVTAATTTTTDANGIGFTTTATRPLITASAPNANLITQNTEYLIVAQVSVNTFNSAIRCASSASDIWNTSPNIIPANSVGEFRVLVTTKSGISATPQAGFIAVTSGSGSLKSYIKVYKNTPSVFPNNPLTDPLPPSGQDVPGNNSVPNGIELKNVAGTSADGYVGVLCPNGKTVPFLKFDGVDSYGMANNQSLDIVGTGDFGFGKVTKVPTLATRYLFSKAEQSEATTQYALKITNTGVLSIILEGTNIQLTTGLLANTDYSIWVERISGVLKCFINGIEVFSVANTTSLTTRPNFRVGALSTNAGGTTHTGYSNANVGAIVITKTDVLKARIAWFNFTSKTFGI